MSQRVRVGQVVTRFMAGAGGVALRGALALDPERYEVVFIVGSGDRLVDDAEAAGFPVVTVPRLRADIGLDDRRALADLTAVMRTAQLDVVHTHSAKAGALGRLAARGTGVPRIVHTFHGFPFHEFQSWPRRGAYVAIERYLGRFTDAFLAVGPQVAAEAIRRGIATAERVRTIGVGVSAGLPPRPVDRAEARRMLGVPPGMRVVGTVGRLDYQKAPEHFVEAVAQVGRDDVLGVWIGDGPLRARTERLAERRGLGARMVFAGQRADVRSLLPGLDLFAMASRYEGLPCAVVEAMAAARPVVATAVNAVPHVVIPGETGLLVPPGRPELLARAMRFLLDRPDVAARLAANARSKVGPDLEPGALGAVLDETYRDIGQSGAAQSRAAAAAADLGVAS